MINKNNFKSFFKKSKNLSYVGIGNISASIITASFSLYLASILEKEAYGELGYLLAIVGTGGAFALLGSNNTLPVYVAKGIKIQSTIFLITIISGIVVSLVILIITQKILVSFHPLAFVFFSLIVYDALGKKIFVNYAKYMISQRLLMVFLSIIFLQIWEIDGIIFGYTLSLGVFGVLLFKGFKENKIDFRLVRSRRTFIVNNFLSHVLGVLTYSIDKLLIYNLFGAAVLGPYQLGFQIFAMILILPHFVSLYTLPHDSGGIKNLQLKKYAKIISIILTVIGIFSSPFIIPVLFPTFLETIDVIQVMSLAIIPATFTVILTSELLANERGKIIIIGSIVSIVSLFIGISILGENLGLKGLALSLVISKSLEFLVMHFINRKQQSHF